MILDEEMVTDFFDEFLKSQESIETNLMLWRDADEDDEKINNLFRAVHTIKGNLFMMELDAIGNIIHSLEDYLSKLREHKIAKIDGFNILISLVIEQCKQLSRKIIEGKDKKITLNKMQVMLTTLSHSSRAEAETVLFDSLTLLDELDECGDEYSLQPLIDFLKKGKAKNSSIAKTKTEELDFFYKLISQVEGHFPYWKGRSENILTLVRRMNESLNCPVDAIQLEASVYMHDIGMSFMPPQKFYASKQLSESDIKLLKLHCHMGAQWLDLTHSWKDASLMIRQHHEWYDGSGYPDSLQGNAICEGAKLLAIGDAYASIMAQSRKGTQKKPIMYAVSEINKGSGLQFDPEWVKIFNDVIRLHFKAG